MRKLLVILLLIAEIGGYAQHAPVAGEPGSTAIRSDSSCFESWATNCNATRGLKNISTPDSGYASAGEDNSAVGKAGENGVVSLGDGGFAILSFNKPIANGQGWDFAVFENSFDNFFLELAFVEVSSDGSNFFRFPSVSLTQDTLQINTFGILEAEKLNNLAGKYRGLYGTPFDLEEMKWVSGLDINNITHIKIIDVTGCINDDYASLDSQGNKVNDPWPTCFPTGGFDLDAVGVINHKSNASEEFPVFIYPNPCKEKLNVEFFEINSAFISLKVNDLTGKTLLNLDGYSNDLKTIDIGNLSSGLYWLTISYSDKQYNMKIMKL
jgi:hypothetical protein